MNHFFSASISIPLAPKPIFNLFSIPTTHWNFLSNALEPSCCKYNGHLYTLTSQQTGTFYVTQSPVLAVLGSPAYGYSFSVPLITFFVLECPPKYDPSSHLFTNSTFSLEKLISPCSLALNTIYMSMTAEVQYLSLTSPISSKSIYLTLSIFT